MTRTIGFIAVSLLLCTGCNNNSTTTTNDTSAAVRGTEDASTSGGMVGAEAASSAGLVTIADGEVELNPSNTRIGWVGTHAGDNPNPRVGSFEEFTGVAEVDPASKTLQSVSIEIETASLKSPIENLTAHLNSPDFFDTREHPKATFKSTNIASDGTITGDLTLHGVTKEISFPATITIDEAGLAVKADFTIDRTEFKIGENQDRVEKEVQISVTVGDEGPPQMLGQQPRDAGFAPDGGGDRQFNPEEFFARRDANGDGKLTGDEISDRMKQNLAETDTDGNGEVSKDEFLARMKRRREESGQGEGNFGNASGASDGNTANP